MLRNSRSCFRATNALTTASSKTFRVSPFFWSFARSFAARYWYSSPSTKWPDAAAPSFSRSLSASVTISGSRSSFPARSCALQLPHDLVEHILGELRRSQEALVRDGRRCDALEDRLFLGLEAGLLSVQGGEDGPLTHQAPQDALRRPDALDLPVVLEGPAPRPNLGERDGSVVERVRTLLLHEVRGTRPFEEVEEVLLAFDPRDLPPEVLPDLLLGELHTLDLLRRQHLLEDLAVELAEQRRPVPHQDDVAHADEHDVVRERARERREVAVLHRQIPFLDPHEDLPRAAGGAG